MNLQWLAWHNLPWIKATGGAVALCVAQRDRHVSGAYRGVFAAAGSTLLGDDVRRGGEFSHRWRRDQQKPGPHRRQPARCQRRADYCRPYAQRSVAVCLFAMAGWLALCTWVASHFQNNVAYAFSAGRLYRRDYRLPQRSTLATLATELWDIAQARVCEVIVGILCGGFMMMILPSTSDGSALMLSLRQMHTRLLDHAVLLLQQSSTENVRTAHETVIGQILTMNLLRIQAFWSHYRFRRQNTVLNYLLHQQLRMTSVISSLRRMLLNWPDAPPALYSAMQQLLHELAQPQCDKYRLAQILRSITPDVHGDFRQRAFVQRLRYFCWVWLNVERWIRLIERADADTRFQPPYAPALARASDSAEAGWSALRTFSVIMLGCAFWIGTQWDAGAAALTLTAIACVLYSSSPSPGGSVSLLLKTLLWLSLFSFVLQFGLMVQISALWQFLLLLFPLLLTLQLFKLQQKQRAALWGQFIVFMGSFIAVSNPPDWDFQSFLNDNLAKVCGVLLAWLAFQVLQPGSDARRSRRHIRALRHAFLDQLRRQPRLSESRFESQIYHHISQLSHSRNEQARLWLLRWGVVLLNCSHIVWQLRAWQPRSPALAQLRDSSLQDLQRIMSLRGVRHDSLQTALDTLQNAIDQLQVQPESDANTLAGMLWRLRCSLAQLRQAVPD